MSNDQQLAASSLRLAASGQQPAAMHRFAP